MKKEILTTVFQHGIFLLKALVFLQKERLEMATRSMMTSVNIKGQKQVKNFVVALEKAETSQGKPVELKRDLKPVSDVELRKISSLIKV
jgi:hypothetical protein